MGTPADGTCPPAETPPPASGAQPVARDAALDPFNLSNDKEYEVTKDTKKRIRQTFGLLEVQHAYPAQKLQLPFVRHLHVDLRALKIGRAHV